MRIVQANCTANTWKDQLISVFSQSSHAGPGQAGKSGGPARHQSEGPGSIPPHVKQLPNSFAFSLWVI